MRDLKYSFFCARKKAQPRDRQLFLKDERFIAMYLTFFDFKQKKFAKIGCFLNCFIGVLLPLLIRVAILLFQFFQSRVYSKN